MLRVPRFAPVVVAMLTLTAAGCSSGDVPDAKGQITMKGTVHAVQASDGTQCWKFQSAAGKAYELQPAQAPQVLLVDGQQATIVVKTRSGGSFCKEATGGTIVDIVSATPEAGSGPGT
jgi:hypothetical protein